MLPRGLIAALAALFVFGLLAQPVLAAIFGAATNFAAGNLPFAVAIADLDGDGRPDLAVSNSNNFTVGVRLNTMAPGAATPTFGGMTTFPVGLLPRGVKAADLDGDGKLDLVTANQTGDNVSVLINTSVVGTVSFGGPTNFPAGTQPIAVALADLNGDGKTDIAVANLASDNVSVLINTSVVGTVSFSGPTNFPVGDGPRGLVAVDFNGDGKLDLATANRNSNNVSVLINTTAGGAPSFSGPTNFGVGITPLSVAAADFNGDGKPDLATANQTGDNVSVLLNTISGGTVTFSGPTNLPAGDGAFAVATADFNGDGKPDIVNANAVDNTVSLHLNQTPNGAATPTFAAQLTFGTAVQPDAVASGDLNADGKPDLAATNATTNNVSVFLNTSAVGTVQFGLASSSVDESAGTATVQVSRTGGSEGAFAANVSLAGGTGSVPGDAALATTSVSWADGDATPKNVQVTLVDDTIVDSGETVILTLTHPSGWLLGAQTTHTLTITDTDVAPVVTTSAGSLAYTENQAATAIDPGLTVIDGDSTNLASAAVQLTTGYQNGQDVLACPACAGLGITATFTPATGGLALSGATTVANYQAALRSVTYQNGSETPSAAARTVTFQAADSPASNVSNVAARQVAVTAVDDPPVGVADIYAALANAPTTVAAPGVLANDTDVDSATLTAVLLTNASHGTITLQPNGGFTYTPAAGYTGPDSFTYAPNDGTSNGNTVTVTLAVGASGLSIDDVTVVEGSAGPKTATFTVSLAPPTSNTVTVQVQTQDGTASAGSDYTAVPLTTLTFGPNETSKSVAVTILGDTAIESNETFTVVLSNPTAAFLTKGTGTGTITDDDGAGTIQFGAATASVAEGAGKVTLTVTRTGGNATVSAQAATSNGTATAGQDFTSTTTTVSFAANETSKTIDIPIASDSLPEADETFSVTLSAPQGGATLGATTTTTVTIVDDDAEPTIGFAIAALTAPEGTSAVVTATLAYPSARAITVAYATQDGTAKAPTDYLAATGTLTFAPGETSKTIPIPLRNDGAVEGAETFTVTLSAPSVANTSGASPSFTIQAGQPTLGTATMTVTIQDVDVPYYNDPNNGDEQRGNNESRPQKETRTEEQRQQQQLTNRSNKDDVYVEGNVVEIHPAQADGTPASIVIALRDGPMVILLAHGASFPSGLKVGDYVEIDGQKEHEQLFWAEQVSISK